MLELALELGPLPLEERARDRRLARARLLDQRRAEGGRLGQRGVLEDAARHTASATSSSLSWRRPAMRRPFGSQLAGRAPRRTARAPRPRAGTPASRRRGSASSLAPALAQPLAQSLDLAPRAVAAGGGAPGAAMTLDRGQRRLGPLRALALDQLGHRQSLELGRPGPERAVVGSPARARSRGTCSGGVAQKIRLMHAALQPHHGAVRQQGVDAARGDHGSRARGGRRPGWRPPCAGPAPAGPARPRSASARPRRPPRPVAWRRASTSCARPPVAADALRSRRRAPRSCARPPSAALEAPRPRFRSRGCA